MKTAVSIPDEVFEQAETLARRANRSRSEVYACALAEYVARHSPDRITDAMNHALDQIEESANQLTSRTARRTLERSEW